MKKQISNEELVDNWFAGKYYKMYQGMGSRPKEDPLLRRFLLEVWLPAERGPNQYRPIGRLKNARLTVWRLDQFYKLYAGAPGRLDVPWNPESPNYGRTD
jgi:hypothetical protein